MTKKHNKVDSAEVPEVVTKDTTPVVVAEEAVASKAVLDTFDVDPNSALFVKYAPETFDPASDWYEFIGDQTVAVDVYTRQGYIAVLNEKGEHVKTSAGEPLFKIERKK